MNSAPKIAIIGGGLAGSECALRLADSGCQVTVFEMKPDHFSPAHQNPDLAELVCSNSFRSDEPETAVGLLKEEMRQLGSIVMNAAEATRVPAGKALAVNRDQFSRHVTDRMEAHPAISLERREIGNLDAPCLNGFDAVVVAAGPLAGEKLSTHLAEIVGEGHLYFYDAIAPIVAADSVDMDKAFTGSRYRPEDDDYLNCPLNREEYLAFQAALVEGVKTPTRDFEKAIFFEGCLPIEVMAERGEMTLAFGPFKPVGLTDPRTEDRPFAVLQLRTENQEKTCYNLVGCQTKLTYPEQDRILRLIPALADAEFLRFGSAHRNTYLNAPHALTPELELNTRPGTFLAGQISGVEGYVESAACGLWLGILLAAKLQGRTLAAPPQKTALGALLYHLRQEAKHFQPTNVHFGLMPPLEGRIKKKERKAAYAARARQAFGEWLGVIRTS